MFLPKLWLGIGQKCKLISPLWCWGSECQGTVSSLLRYKRGPWEAEWGSGSEKKEQGHSEVPEKKCFKICIRFWGAPSSRCQVALHQLLGYRKMFQWAQSRMVFYGNQFLDLQLMYIFIPTISLAKIRSAFCCSRFLSITQPLIPLYDRKADLSWSRRAG